MNALTTVNQAMPSSVQPLPAPLAAVLERTRLMRLSFSDLPLLNPDERALVPAALASVEATLVPATHEEIATILGTIAMALPKRQSDADAAAMLEVYIATLDDIPVDVLRMAAKEAIKMLKFFPKVAELREISERELTVRRWRKVMLETLARKHDEEWRDPVPKHDFIGPENMRALHKRLSSRFPSKRGAVAG